MENEDIKKTEEVKKDFKESDQTTEERIQAIKGRELAEREALLDEKEAKLAREKEFVETALKRLEQGGRAIMQQQKPKVESAKEYAERIMSGKNEIKKS